MVARTRARVEAAHLTNVRCEQRDLYALGEPDGTFDAVVAANVLHLVPDLEGAMQAMRRALRPGCRLIVPTFCHGETRVSRTVARALAWVSFPAERRLDLPTLTRAVAHAGFRIEESTSIPGLLPIGFVAGRRGEGSSE
jgi:ubiquinone/menaquinone biosynthesis C-methylase UbiE